MTPLREISDLELNALLDGELQGAEAEAVRTAVADSEPLKAKAASAEVLQGLLHGAYDPVLSQAADPRVVRMLAAQPRRMSLRAGAAWRTAVAAALILLATGIGYLAGQWPPAPGTLKEQQLAQLALGAHRVFASEVRHPVEIAGADRDELGQWLGKRLGVDLPVPDIAATGFMLVGGRLLAEAGDPAALLMYEDGSGRRVTLYVERWDGEGESAFRYVEADRLGSYSWVDHPLACAVTGDLGRDELRGVADKIYAALERR